jgi:rhodanese-related sulfurtransferase
MFHWFSRLPTNQRLAALALVLGVGAIAATPTRQGRVTLSPTELGLIVQRQADQVSAAALADDLVKGDARYRVIDVRDEAAYNAYHLPTAENIPVGALATADLPRNERFLLYGADDVRGAQAWFLLKAEGYPAVYRLRGGLTAWNDDVLRPVLSAATTADQRRENEQRTAVAAFFGGTPRAASTESGSTGPAAVPMAAAVPAAEAPALKMPAGAKPKPQIKKKEGC